MRPGKVNRQRSRPALEKRAGPRDGHPKDEPAGKDPMTPPGGEAWKRAAAEALREAVEIFERLGAPAWEQQARGELGRVGLRRAPDELTATELRVAELAAAGLTNREVASAAFMSPKTVQANLARIYRKLGISSRAELGARMADERRQVEPQK